MRLTGSDALVTSQAICQLRVSSVVDRLVLRECFVIPALLAEAEAIIAAKDRPTAAAAAAAGEKSKKGKEDDGPERTAE